MARRKAPRIPDALLDQLLAGADRQTAFDTNGLLDDLKKTLAEIRRHLDAIELAQMPDILPGAHATGIHRHTLIVEAGKAALVPGNERDTSTRSWPLAGRVHP